MEKQKVIEYFGNSVPKVARAMKLTPAAVYAWPEKLAFEVACRVQVVTDNALKVDKAQYPEIEQS